MNEYLFEAQPRSAIYPSTAAADREQDRIADRRDDLLSEAMRGAGDFWPVNDWKLISEGPKWDAEQFIPLMVAIRKAVSGIGLTDSERWNIVQLAVLNECEEYARWRAERGRL